MDSADAWDLEMELLLLPAQGGSVRKMQKLSQGIARVCGDDVPVHIRDLAALRDSSHRERDLHRWVSRQVWRDLLPDVYEFDLPYTPDQINEEFAELKRAPPPPTTTTHHHNHHHHQ